MSLELPKEVEKASILDAAGNKQPLLVKVIIGSKKLFLIFGFICRQLIKKF